MVSWLLLATLAFAGDPFLGSWKLMTMTNSDGTIIHVPQELGKSTPNCTTLDLILMVESNQTHFVSHSICPMTVTEGGEMVNCTASRPIQRRENTTLLDHGEQWAEVTLTRVSIAENEDKHGSTTDRRTRSHGCSVSAEPHTFHGELQRIDDTHIRVAYPDGIRQATFERTDDVVLPD